MVPISLYIHIPWCVKKCPYCDFNSHAKTGDVPEQQYVTALLQDLASDLPYIQGRQIHSIFMGGGTPSLFSPQAFAQLLTGIRALCVLAPTVEITLEANPGTIEHGQFSDYRALGINRVSLGVQSFQNQQLQVLGRIHRQEEVFKAVAELKQAGFDNFNLDLMHGLPAQSVPQALDDLSQAIALAPSHLSWYQLTIEPNTIFYSKPPVLPDEDRLADIEIAGISLLASAGFISYETSAYSRIGRQCQHNLNYWRFGDYVGIGAGAHGKWTDLATGRVTRLWKKKQPKAYLEGGSQFIGGQQCVTSEELPFEFMLNVLRLKEGFSPEQYHQATGLLFDNIQPRVARAIAKGLLEETGGVIRPTELGARFLNDTICLFK